MKGHRGLIDWVGRMKDPVLYEELSSRKLAVGPIVGKLTYNIYTLG